MPENRKDPVLAQFYLRYYYNTATGDGNGVSDLNEKLTKFYTVIIHIHGTHVSSTTHEIFSLRLLDI